MCIRNRAYGQRADPTRMNASEFVCILYVCNCRKCHMCLCLASTRAPSVPGIRTLEGRICLLHSLLLLRHRMYYICIIHRWCTVICAYNLRKSLPQALTSHVFTCAQRRARLRATVRVKCEYSICARPRACAEARRSGAGNGKAVGVEGGIGWLMGGKRLLVVVVCIKCTECVCLVRLGVSAHLCEKFNTGEPCGVVMLCSARL